jgi:hypothetical protein
MRARTLAAVAALLFAATACNDQTPTGATRSPSSSEQRAPRPSGGPIVQAVSGVLSDGGSFVGTLTITSFSYNGTTLIANGTLSGTATTIGGTVTTITNQAYSAPAKLANHATATTVAAVRGNVVAPAGASAAAPSAARAQAAIACDVLFLDLGPIHLDLLGLTVDLSEVVLDVNAVPGAGNLLGNLLCALLGLLDGPGLFAAIIQLLDQINQILAAV